MLNAASLSSPATSHAYRQQAARSTTPEVREQ